MSEKSLNELLLEAAERFDLVDILEELDCLYKNEHYVFSFKIDEVYLLSEIEKLNNAMTELRQVK